LGTKETIIKSISWFGVNFYERRRLSEKKLNLEFDSVHCEDIGLYVIGKYPRLKYRNTSYSENFNWQWQVIETLRLTILNLLNNRVIEIIMVEDKISYLYNSFQKSNYDFIFRVTDLQNDKDWLSQLIYRTINEVNVKKHRDLNDYINAIMDKIIYEHGVYNNPSKTFVIQILKHYSKAFPWIHIDTKSKFLGLLENHNLKVAEVYIPRLSMQHKSLTDLDNNLLRVNKGYAHFTNCLKFEIEKELGRRKTSD